MYDKTTALLITVGNVKFDKSEWNEEKVFQKIKQTDVQTGLVEFYKRLDHHNTAEGRAEIVKELARYGGTIHGNTITYSPTDRATAMRKFAESTTAKIDAACKKVVENPGDKYAFRNFYWTTVNSPIEAPVLIVANNGRVYQHLYMLFEAIGDNYENLTIAVHDAYWGNFIGE